MEKKKEEKAMKIHNSHFYYIKGGTENESAREREKSGRKI